MNHSITPLACDVAIVGAGPVGAALALALADSGLTVVLLEARDTLQTDDPRALALSQGTRLILERLGAWAALAPHATAIDTIHVSQRGGFGRAVLAAGECGVPALGFVAGYGALHAALARGLIDCGATLVTGARVAGVAATGACAALRYEHGGRQRMLSARLAVLSEGGRALPPGPRHEKDYRQSAVICTVATERAHGQRAYERFTPEGPIALLPLGEDYALVWTTPAGQVAARMALDDAGFIARLQAAFGARQGRFLRVGPRAAYPLRLILAADTGSPRMVRIGNAAHVLHPVAGQGFNLGLRDAWQLAEAILDTPRERLGEANLAAVHAGRRRVDVLGGSLMTDLMVEAFANDQPLVRHARGAALALMDLAPPLKALFARKMMFGARTW